MLDAAAAHDNDRTAQSTDGFSSICRARLPCLERGRELTAQPKGDQFTANWKQVAMRRYLDDLLTKDLQRKMVLITGARQVGKATLCRKFMERFNPSQCLNWDVAADSAVLPRQGWSPRTRRSSSRAAPAWKPGARAVIRWPAVTCCSGCTPFPCASGASSRARRPPPLSSVPDHAEALTRHTVGALHRVHGTAVAPQHRPRSCRRPRSVSSTPGSCAATKACASRMRWPPVSATTTTPRTSRRGSS